jgi:hypothetical protein
VKFIKTDPNLATHSVATAAGLMSLFGQSSTRVRWNNVEVASELLALSHGLGAAQDQRGCHYEVADLSGRKQM